MSQMTDLQYYTFERVERRVVAHLLRNPILIEKHPMTKEDFHYFSAGYGMLEQICRQSYCSVAKDTFVSTYVQTLAEKTGGDSWDDQEGLYQLQKKANKIYDNSIALGETLDSSNFEADYLLLKKYSMLRQIHKHGIDVTDFFKPGEQDEIASLQRLGRFANTTIDQMLTQLISPLYSLERQFSLDLDIVEEHSSKGMKGLLHFLKQGKMYGVGHPSGFMNTITDGQLPGKLIITSASTNAGKTRNSTASVCHAAMPCYYDGEKGQWMKNPNGQGNRVLYIVTETDPDEVRTAMLAYTANVNETKILHDTCSEEEYKRVELASNMFYRNYIWIVYMAEPTVARMDDCIRRHVKEFGVSLVYFDYIQPNQELVMEFTGGTKGMQAREDQALSNFSKRLKAMAKRYNVFISSYTQANADLKQSTRRDETVVAGAKAIIFKADTAVIMERPSESDLEAIKPLQEGFIEPNLVYTIYKNRGEHNHLRVWVHFDFACMRVEDLFVTDKQNQAVVSFPKKYFQRNDEGHLVVRNVKPEIPLTEDEICELLETEPTVEELEEKTCKQSA